MKLVFVSSCFKLIVVCIIQLALIFEHIIVRGEMPLQCHVRRVCFVSIHTETQSASSAQTFSLCSAVYFRQFWIWSSVLPHPVHWPSTKLHSDLHGVKIPLFILIKVALHSLFSTTSNLQLQLLFYLSIFDCS